MNMSACCLEPLTVALPSAELRCTRCGHRAAPAGSSERVQASRRRPPWTWPGELLGRRRARRYGREMRQS